MNMVLSESTYAVLYVDINTFYQYNHSRNTIVKESIKYIERKKESNLIADLLTHRQGLRNEDPCQSMDKNINPLIAVPGSPGSGKSTFLAHLAESAAMTTYYRERSAPIVVPVTFNSRMPSYYYKLQVRQ